MDKTDRKYLILNLMLNDCIAREIMPKGYTEEFIKENKTDLAKQYEIDQWELEGMYRRLITDGYIDSVTFRPTFEGREFNKDKGYIKTRKRERLTKTWEKIRINALLVIAIISAIYGTVTYMANKKSDSIVTKTVEENTFLQTDNRLLQLQNRQLEIENKELRRKSK